MPVVTICSSAAFYKQVLEAQAILEKQGFTVHIPATARVMGSNGNFEVTAYKTWFKNADDYKIKTSLMRGHFAEIEKAEAILVLNHEKHGVQNYIGGNVLMEMAVAFHLEKSIFLLNDAPADSAFIEEILGMQPVVLKGDVGVLRDHFTG